MLFFYLVKEKGMAWFQLCADTLFRDQRWIEMCVVENTTLDISLKAQWLQYTNDILSQFLSRVGKIIIILITRWGTIHTSLLNNFWPVCVNSIATLQSSYADLPPLSWTLPSQETGQCSQISIEKYTSPVFKLHEFMNKRKLSS